VLKQSPRCWLLSNGLTIAISFIFKFQAYFLAYDSNETQNFDGELQFIFLNAKVNGTSPKPFSFIYDFFPKSQNPQHVGINVRPLMLPKTKSYGTRN
jgi:hypothetical protein